MSYFPTALKFRGSLTGVKCTTSFESGSGPPSHSCPLSQIFSFGGFFVADQCLTHGFPGPPGLEKERTQCSGTARAGRTNNHDTAATIAASQLRRFIAERLYLDREVLSLAERFDGVSYLVNHPSTGREDETESTIFERSSANWRDGRFINRRESGSRRYTRQHPQPEHPRQSRKPIPSVHRIAPHWTGAL